MAFKKTRIAFSVSCGMLCLLLAGLWVRSYFAFDRLSGQVANDRSIILVSYAGGVTAAVTSPGTLKWNTPRWDSGPILANNITHDDWTSLVQTQSPSWNDTDIVWPERTILGFGWMIRGTYNNIPNGETGWHPQGLSGRSWTADANGLRVPHWFGVLTLAFLASLPWLAWSVRFSLRTLLIVMTAVAVGLWFILWMVRR
jgi:hypothetical protein